MRSRTPPDFLSRMIEKLIEIILVSFVPGICWMWGQSIFCQNYTLFVEKRGILTDLEEYRFVGMAIVDLEIPDPAVAHAPAVTCCGDWFL